MTDRLNSGTSTKPTNLTSLEWCDRGNAYLRGEIPGVKGEFIPKPRHDVHWIVRNGRATIEFVR